MRFSVVLVVFVNLYSIVLAQESDKEFDSFIDSKLVSKWGVYGCFESKIATDQSNVGTFLGMKMGVIANDKVGMGMEVGGFVTKDIFEGTGGDGESTLLKYAMGYGGFVGEYIAMMNKKVHLTFPVLFGLGLGMLMDEDLVAEDVGNENLVEGTMFLVIEPSINLEFNITKEIQLYIGPSYRIVSGSAFDRLSDKELSGMGINFGLKVGSF